MSSDEKMSVVEKLINESKSIKNKEDRDDFLIMHGICPVCLTQTIVKDENCEKYCTKCGLVIQDGNFYYSHGITKENGDREEIYIPPTNRAMKSSVYSGFFVDSNISQSKRSLYKRLQRQELYESAKNAESPYTYKSVKQVVSSLKEAFPIHNKTLIVETAMSIYMTQIKRNGAKIEKIKPQILVWLALKKLKIHISYKKYVNLTYKTTVGLKNRTVTNYKNTISKNMSKAITGYTKEEKELFKKNEIEYILLKENIDFSKELVNNIYDMVNEILIYNPNLSFEFIAKKMITYKELENKRKDLNTYIANNNTEKNINDINRHKEKLKAVEIKEDTIKKKIKKIDDIIMKHKEFEIGYKRGVL